MLEIKVSKELFKQLISNEDVQKQYTYFATVPIETKSKEKPVREISIGNIRFIQQ